MVDDGIKKVSMFRDVDAVQFKEGSPDTQEAQSLILSNTNQNQKW